MTARGSLRALLLAPPGAGKGTQGILLAERFGVEHLATGDLLRAEVSSGSAIGQEAREWMDAGELVPDRLVIALVLARVLGPPPVTGFVLDGYPRTLVQAEEAYTWGRRNGRTFNAVITLEVPDAELVTRLTARGLGSGRVDDREGTIQHRLEVYRASTEPLLEFYRLRDILVEVDGTGTVEEVASRIDSGLGRLGVVPAP